MGAGAGDGPVRGVAQCTTHLRVWCNPFVYPLVQKNGLVTIGVEPALKFSMFGCVCT